MFVSELQQDLFFLSQTSGKLEHLLEGLSHQSLRRRVMPVEFSVLETICHLRDIECDAYEVRIRRILAEDNPMLDDIDGAQLAVERDYNNQNVFAALRSFSVARTRNVEILSNLTADECSRSGNLENTGKVSLVQLVGMIREHDQSHLEELEVIRRRLTEVH